ncbi:MAG: hypothetical protein CMC79_02360 [Flavobacteriaceae bacterium]|nr:hypothetical protein [Flavobacteriaceae bacterium]|tara:strand:- start:5606 stop:5902 length:297 start_codon:yes stop_codon:yes gene_type:complete
MSKRKFDIQKLSEVITEFSNQKQINPGLYNVRISEIWKNTMGKNILAYTEKVSLKKDKLYVKIKSSALKEELRFGESKITKLLNENIGSNSIKQIVFY